MVKNLFSMLYSRQTSILSGAVIIMATVILSKILGLARDRLLTHIFTPDDISIFFAAFGIPDIIFQLLVFGALSVAFIPVFTEYAEEKGKEAAFRLAGSILNLALVVLSIAIIIILIFIDPLTAFVVPGFSVEQRLQTITLTRVILLGQLFLVIGSLFSGMLQSFQRFIIPALAGVFYNVGIILGIVLLSSSLGMMAAAIGVVIGAVLHFMIQLPVIVSTGFRPKFLLTFFHPGVKEITGLMSIRSLGLAAELFNERVAIALASLISVQSVTFLTLSQHLQLVPISLFGATIAQAALPVLSSERARGRIEEFKTTLLTTMHQILFLALPAAAILIVLRIPAVRLVFGASQFNWEATVLTGLTLAYLSIGLAAQAVSLLLVRGFYAFKDTRTPVAVSLIVVVTNVALSLYFVKSLRLDVWSLGFAFSISSILSAVLLFSTLHFKVGKFDLKAVLIPFFKMVMATIIMGVALYVPIKLLDQVIFDTTRTLNLLILTGISSTFALCVYVFLVWYLKVRELQTYADLLRRVAKFQSKFKAKEIITPESGTV